MVDMDVSSTARVMGQVITPWAGDRDLRYVWGPWLGARPWAGDRAWGVVGGGPGTDACAGVGGDILCLWGAGRGVPRVVSGVVWGSSVGVQNG